MTRLLERLDTWGMETDPEADWRGDAACVGDWDSFTEQLMPTSGVVPRASAAAQHNCNHHCPVLLQCTLQAETPGKRPQDMVQAGKWWPAPHRPPRTLPDPGHGPHCAHLRRQRLATSTTTTLSATPRRPPASTSSLSSASTQSAMKPHASSTRRAGR